MRAGTGGAGGSEKGYAYPCYLPAGYNSANLRYTYSVLAGVVVRTAAGAAVSSSTLRTTSPGYLALYEPAGSLLTYSVVASERT